jgi:hypothetical protein
VATPAFVGTAVLRDFPLRLWQRQSEHAEELMREFRLLLIGERTGTVAHHAPARLLELADLMDRRFRPQLDAIYAERWAAVDRGADRIDQEIPLAEETPVLMAQVRAVLDEVDRFCREGDLITLARTPELVALSDWTLGQLVRQYEGLPPRPWAGPWD